MTNSDGHINDEQTRLQENSISGTSEGLPISIVDMAEATVNGIPEKPAVILRMTLMALSNGPRVSVADRRSLYLLIQKGQEQGIIQIKLPEETAEFYRRQLRTVIRLVETDIRAGENVFSTGYMPASLVADDARLVISHEQRSRRREAELAQETRRQASRHDVPYEIALLPDEVTDAVALRARLLPIHARQPLRQPWQMLSRSSAIMPLLILQLHIIHAESRIALLWALIGPAVLVTLISSLYFLTGAHYILGMDVPTFALVGATTWIMFRQIIFRCSTSYVSARSLLNLQAVTPLTLVVVQSSIYLFIYLTVYAVLLTAGYQLGILTLPASWIGFIFYLVMIAIGGTSIGLIFGSIATRWHFFLRFAAVIERFLEIFSSVFFVSEQLPEQYRRYILWSPFAHGLQLLRSTYFASYKSFDASFSYFIIAIIFLAVIGGVANRLARTNVQPM